MGEESEGTGELGNEATSLASNLGLGAECGGKPSERECIRGPSCEHTAGHGERQEIKGSVYAEGPLPSKC